MNSRIIVLSLLLFSGVTSAVEITNPYFRLNMPGDWKQEAGLDPEQFVITSESRQAQLTISYMPMNTQDQNLKHIANKLLEFRFSAEREATPDREVFFSEPWGTEHSDGSIQVNYFGRDSFGRYFFFTGFITKTHTTSITGELMQSSEPSLQQFYQEVLTNFGY